jgi:hypothetical protein
MEKEFTSYTEALALKELRFNEPCFGYYDIKDNNLQLFSDNLQDASCNSDLKYDDFKHCTAPLYQQAFRWFREKHNLPSHIATYWQHDWNNYSYQYHFVENKTEWFGIEHYKTYEEAEFACLKKLIEIAKNK